MAKMVFLGGAPKCGTSKLFDILSHHPDISRSTPKETFFFMDADNPLNAKNISLDIGVVDEFAQFFSDNTVKYNLEGTTHTLYQQTIFPSLKKLKDPYFLFVLRNPVDRLRSSYQYTKNNLARLDRELSFEDFCLLLLHGQANQLNQYVHHPASLFVLQKDLEYGCYATFLESYYQQFGNEKIKVVLYEEFINQPIKTINTIFNWLGLSEVSIAESIFKQERNATQSIRSKRMHKLAWTIKAFLPSSWNMSILKRLYFLFQASPKKQLSLSSQTEKALYKYYHPFNKELETLISMRLPNSWYLHE